MPPVMNPSQQPYAPAATVPQPYAPAATAPQPYAPAATMAQPATAQAAVPPAPEVELGASQDMDEITETNAALVEAVIELQERNDWLEGRLAAVERHLGLSEQ